MTRSSPSSRAAALLLVAALFSTALPDLALAAGDIFEAPTSVLDDVKAFIMGAPGIIIGGLVIAGAAIAAASPRMGFSWGSFFITIVVVAVFFGAFKIAETLQAVSA